MLHAVFSEFGDHRYFVFGSVNMPEARRDQSVAEILEVVSPTMFVPLVEDVIDDIHPRREVPGKRLGYSQFSKASEIASTVRAKIPLGVGYDDPQHPARA